MGTKIGRRHALGLAVAAGAMGSRLAQAQPAEVKVALLAPLSGPWARQGLLMKAGAELGIEDANADGGIKSLGGAKMKLVVYDAGSSAETTKNAAQRMVAEQPDLVAGTGAWLSSFTLAATEVTERAELPWLTLSFSDAITNRGFRYVFQTTMTAEKQSVEALSELLNIGKLAGVTVTKFGILCDNSASAVNFIKPYQAGELDKRGIQLVMKEIYTAPLADATSMVQRVRSTKPQLLFMGASNVSDNKLLLDKMNEYGLGHGRVPSFGSGAAVVAPEMLDVVGKDELDGFMSVVANWGGKGQEAITQRFMAKTKEPWFGQDSIQTYFDMLLMKAAIEKAGAADRHKVADALRSMDVTDGPALLLPGRRVKFDDKGRIEDAELVIVQWQAGKPVPVYPTTMATAKAVWPKG